MLRINLVTTIGIICVGLVSCIGVLGQVPNNNNTANRYGGMQNLGTNPYAGNSQDMSQEGQDANANQEKKDTTRKIRKPLESYFFNDSVRKQPNFVWNIDMYRNNVNIGQIDTMINLSQIEYPFQRSDVGDAYLGNLGGATIPLNYFRRPDSRNFQFVNAYYAYMLTPDKVNFYNVKKPFSHLSYFMAGQKKYAEESLWVTHAQNASPSTGFNVAYKSIGTKGIYTWQKTRDKNLSIALSHTGKRYSAHGGYIYNSVDLKENGGVQNDRDITDTVFELPENVPVRLHDARNKIKNNTFFLVQSYGIPLKKLTDEDFSIADRSSLFIGHAIEYNRYFKKYTDTKNGSGDFYKNWYIDPQVTRDSIFESLLSNRLFIQIQPWDRDGIVGLIDAGVGMDNHHYYQFRLEDYTQGANKGVNKSEIYVYGSIKGKLKKYFSWGGDLRYHPVGYRSQDILFGGNAAISAFIKGHPITLSGKFSYDLRSPGYWSDTYFSNHFAWFNSFAKENETRIEATLKMPYIGTELGAYQSVIKNKIYYDSESIIAQHSGSVSVSGLYAQKDFRLGGLHLNHRVLLQWSTAQEIIPVPLASAYLSYYFEFNVVKDVLRVQTGFDGRYNTKYYAFGYNPAIAQFYNQREKEVAGYPMIDAFVAAKWKRMRIILKYQHANEDLIGGNKYFTTLHYPLNKRIFKLGISWGFYD